MKFWIARDYTGLWAFSEEPDKNHNQFVSATIHCKIYELDSDLFPEITYENSPQQVEIKLVKEE